MAETMLKADEFMQRYIVEPREAADPHTRKEPFIRDKGTPVWVVVGYYLGGHSSAQTAAAFALTEEELQAALRYYERHEAEIKHRIEMTESLVV
jgi:uncharacterized protein (DUF433 family)